MSEAPEVLSFRVGEVEKSLRELRGEMKEAVGQLGGGMTALQTQLASYQTSVGDRFVPRREYEQRHSELQQAVMTIRKELQAEIDQLEQASNQDSMRFWMALSALGTIGAFVAAVIGWFRPLH